MADELEQRLRRYQEAQRMAQLGEIDRQTGADVKARTAVGLAKSDADKLATAKKFYPNAFWLESGGETLNRQTGTQVSSPRQRELAYRNNDKIIAFNKGGLDAGDIAEQVQPVADMAGAGIGLAVGGFPGMIAGEQIADSAIEGFGRTFLDVADTRTPAQVAVDRLMKTAQSAAGGGAGEAALQIGRGVKMGMTVPGGPAQGRPTILQDLKDIGAPLAGAAPLVTDSIKIKQMTNALAKMPRTAETIQTALVRTYNAIGNEAKRVFQQLSTATEQAQAGSSLQAGIKNWKAANIAAGEQLGEEVDKLVPGGTMVPAGNTANLILERLEKLKATPNSAGIAIPETFKKLYADIQANNGQIPWDAWMTLRRSIGKDTSRKIDPSLSQKDANTIYKMMSADAREAVSKTGNKAARDAFDAEQAHWANHFELLDEVSTIADSAYADQAFRAAFSSKDPAQLIALRKTVPKEAWDDLVAVKLRDMAMTPRGAGAGTEKEFSASRFIGNWRDMPDSIKTTLFGMASSKERQAYDRLARLSAAVDESKAAMMGGNPSGTAGQLFTMEDIARGAITADPKQTASVFFMRWLRNHRQDVQANLITDPDFVNWLVSGQKLPMTNRNAIGAYVTRLGGVGMGKSDAIKSALKEFSNSLSVGADEDK